MLSARFARSSFLALFFILEIATGINGPAFAQNEDPTGYPGGRMHLLETLNSEQMSIQEKKDAIWRQAESTEKTPGNAGAKLIDEIGSVLLLPELSKSLGWTAGRALARRKTHRAAASICIGKALVAPQGDGPPAFMYLRWLRALAHPASAQYLSRFAKRKRDPELTKNAHYTLLGIPGPHLSSTRAQLASAGRTTNLFFLYAARGFGVILLLFFLFLAVRRRNRPPPKELRYAVDE